MTTRKTYYKIQACVKDILNTRAKVDSLTLEYLRDRIAKLGQSILATPEDEELEVLCSALEETQPANQTKPTVINLHRKQSTNPFRTQTKITNSAALSILGATLAGHGTRIGHGLLHSTIPTPTVPTAPAVPPGLPTVPGNGGNTPVSSSRAVQGAHQSIINTVGQSSMLTPAAIPAAPLPNPPAVSQPGSLPVPAVTQPGVATDQIKPAAVLPPIQTQAGAGGPPPPPKLLNILAGAGGPPPPPKLLPANFLSNLTLPTVTLPPVTLPSITPFQIKPIDRQKIIDLLTNIPTVPLKLMDLFDFADGMNTHAKEMVRSKMFGYIPGKGCCAKIRYLMFRVWNAIKAIFGQSDWHKARKCVLEEIAVCNTPTFEKPNVIAEKYLRHVLEAQKRLVS